MDDLERQLREDRLLRDTAKAVVLADIEHVKREMTPAPEAGADLTSRARDLADDTRDYVSDHRHGIGAAVAATVAAIALWLFREPLLALVRDLMAGDDAEEAESDPEQPYGDERSSHDQPFPAETES